MACGWPTPCKPQHLRLTHSGDVNGKPRWDPQGQWWSFLASRDEPEKMQGWKRKTKPPLVLDRFHFKQDIEGYLGPQKTI